MGDLHEGYFDPIALLAEDSLVPCEFLYPVRALGKLLDPTSTSADLRKDTNTDLPMWLGKALTERHLTSMHTPAVYGHWMQRQVDAGAACISLKKHPFFYNVGMQCAIIMPDSSLAAFLRSTFSQRSRDLLCGSLKAPDGASLQKVLGKLNTEEKKLYEAGRQGAEAQTRWWAAGGHKGLRNNSSALNRAAASAPAGCVKRKRTSTTAAGDKENVATSS